MPTSMRLPVIGIAIALLIFGGSPWPSSATSCSMVPRLLPHQASSIAILTVATGDSVEFPVEPPPRFGSVVWDNWPSDTRVVGQQFEVVATTQGSGLESSIVTVVPWSYTSACQLAPWVGQATWVPPGDTAYFLASAVGSWTDPGIRFDVYGGLMPYPKGPYYRTGWRSVNPPDTTSASEVFDLANHVVLNRPYGSRDEVISIIEAWAEAVPGARRSYPITALVGIREGAS